MKPREFWVNPLLLDIPTYQIFNLGDAPPHKESIHVREVNPAYDEAVKKLVEAVNKITYVLKNRTKLHSTGEWQFKISGDIWQDLREALAHFNEVTKGEKE